MVTLAIRSDKPEAEICLYLDNKKIAEIKWQAHRQLAETLHQKIEQLLAFFYSSPSQSGKNVKGPSFHIIDRVAVYEGPGSFTGLRIGISVANALGYGLGIPVVSATGDDWIMKCIQQKHSGKVVLPMYGADPHITEQKK